MQTISIKEFIQQCNFKKVMQLKKINLDLLSNERILKGSNSSKFTTVSEKRNLMGTEYIKSYSIPTKEYLRRVRKEYKRLKKAYEYLNNPITFKELTFFLQTTGYYVLSHFDKDLKIPGWYGFTLEEIFPDRANNKNVDCRYSVICKHDIKEVEGLIVAGYPGKSFYINELIPEEDVMSFDDNYGPIFMIQADKEFKILNEECRITFKDFSPLETYWERLGMGSR